MIERIAAVAAVRPGTAIGIGDDAAVLEPCGSVVLAHDLLVQDVHFRLPTAARDLGWKALAINLSDLAAMGAEPVAALVGLALPGPDALDIEAFYGGMEELAAQTGTTIAGGDLSEGATLAIAVSVAGRLGEGRSPLTRAGARPGDRLVVTGPLGASEAGRALLEQPAHGEGLSEAVCAALLKAHERPQPELAAARTLRALGATALMDCSDGLMLDGGRMAEASGCGLMIDLEAVPRADGIDPVAAALGVQPDVFAATSGEDYRLLAAVRGDAVPGALQAFPGGAIVGTFMHGTGGAAQRDGVRVALDRTGYTHDV